jgi:hypothetical protein
VKALGPFVRLAALSFVVLGVVVLAAPDHTSVAVRIEIAVLAAIGAFAVLDVARRRSPPLGASPFDRTRPRRHAPTVPADVDRLAVDLRALAAHPGDAPLPGGLRRTVRAITASRLADHHGLHVDDPDDADAIRACVGPALMDALEGRAVAIDADELVATVEAL